MKIIFENNDISVVIKEPGEDSEEKSCGSNVPQLLREHWGVPDAYVGVVHRLDNATGGVMVYARNKAAAAALSEQTAAHSMSKEYVCICAGVPEPSEGEMKNWLFKDSRKNKVFPVKGPRKGAKDALLNYKVLRSYTLAAEAEGSASAAASDNTSDSDASRTTVSEKICADDSDKMSERAGCTVSMCSVSLCTGRTHQIRVQFASRKHPLLGDRKYGSRVTGPLALFCRSLTFTVPGTAEAQTFTAELPDYFSAYM